MAKAFVARTFRIPAETFNEIERLAKADDRPVSHYVARALQMHVDAVKARSQGRGVVHHVDGDPRNNDLANLVVMPE